MRILLRLTLSLTLFFLFLVLPPKALAAVTFFLAPNPPIENKPVHLYVQGCSPDSKVTITWKKQGGNKISKEATADFEGKASYYADGYSLDENSDGTFKYYDAKATCSDGSSAQLRFTPITQPTSGYSISTDGSKHGDFYCKPENTEFAAVYPTLASCTTTLDRLKKFSGNYWTITQGFNGDICTARNLGAPHDSNGIYYSTYQECTASITPPDALYLCPGVGMTTGGPFCTAKPEDSLCGNDDESQLPNFATMDACKEAILERYVFIIQLTDSTGVTGTCIQVKKENAGSTSYIDKSTCEEALSNSTRWAARTLEQVFRGSPICYTSLSGNYTSKDSCELGFCNDLKRGSDQGDFIKNAFSQYCEDVLEGDPTILDPEPSPPPCRLAISNEGCTSVFSAFGIFNTDPQGFLTKLFSVLLSLSGGIALLFIIRSGYQLMTSQGDPEKVKEARERITSAIVGLLFIVFSLVILEVIGVDILGLPGLNR